MARQNLQLRIGLNIGDVVVEGDDLLGDGVNVAARLEALAEPGGICLSRAVFEQVRGKIDARFEPLGQHTVKNITKTISVYRLALDGKTQSAPLRWLNKMRRRRQTIPVLAGLVAPVRRIFSLVLLAGTAAGAQQAFDRCDAAYRQSAPMSRHSVSRTGLLRTLLPTCRALPISRWSPAIRQPLTRTNRRAQVRSARHLVSPMSWKVRSSGRLKGCASRHNCLMSPRGTHLWTQRWDRPTQETFAVQSELAEQIAASLASAESSAALTAGEIRKVKGRPPASLQAYDFYLLAMEANGKFTKEAVFSDHRPCDQGDCARS